MQKGPYLNPISKSPLSKDHCTQPLQSKDSQDHWGMGGGSLHPCSCQGLLSIGQAFWKLFQEYMMVWETIHSHYSCFHTKPNTRVKRSTMVLSWYSLYNTNIWQYTFSSIMDSSRPIQHKARKHTRRQETVVHWNGNFVGLVLYSSVRRDTQ